MDSVSLFVKTIIAITFMWCIAETILPDNAMQKYSSFIYGLVIISLTVSVFTKIDFNDFFTQTATVNLSEYNSSYLKGLYEDRLELTLKEKFGDESIKVELTDEYKIKNIYCDNQKTHDDIMRYLNE